MQNSAKSSEATFHRILTKVQSHPTPVPQNSAKREKVVRILTTFSPPSDIAMSNAPGFDSRHFDGAGGVIVADGKKNPPLLAMKRIERCNRVAAFATTGGKISLSVSSNPQWNARRFDGL